MFTSFSRLGFRKRKQTWSTMTMRATYFLSMATKMTVLHCLSHDSFSFSILNSNCCSKIHSFWSRKFFDPIRTSYSFSSYCNLHLIPNSSIALKSIVFVFVFVFFSFVLFFPLRLIFLPTLLKSSATFDQYSHFCTYTSSHHNSSWGG